MDYGKGRRHRGCRRDQGGGVEGSYGKLKQPVSITQASAMAEWEVVMEQSKLPLSGKRAQRGQA